VPASAICARSSCGLLLILATPSRLTSSVIRTSTDRRREREAPLLHRIKGGANSAWGPVSRQLGRLGAAMGRTADAVRDFDEAIEARGTAQNCRPGVPGIVFPRCKRQKQLRLAASTIRRPAVPAPGARLLGRMETTTNAATRSPALDSSASERDQPKSAVELTQVSGIGGDDWLVGASGADDNMGIGDVGCPAGGEQPADVCRVDAV
jgi:hypothetical protein